MSPTAALLFYNRAAVESNRGSEQAHKVRAMKGAHEQSEWELHSCRPDIKIKSTVFFVNLFFYDIINMKENMKNSYSFIGKIIKVKTDRPLHSKHPKEKIKELTNFQEKYFESEIIR